MLPRNPVAENVQFLVENARIEASLKAYHLIAAEVAHMAIIKTCRDFIMVVQKRLVQVGIYVMDKLLLPFIGREIEACLPTEANVKMVAEFENFL